MTSGWGHFITGTAPGRKGGCVSTYSEFISLSFESWSMSLLVFCEFMEKSLNCIIESWGTEKCILSF